MRQFHILTVLAMMALLCCKCTASPQQPGYSTPKDRFDPIRKRVDSLIQQKAMPSMSIAVIQDGKIAWMESFGWADVASKKKATPQTVYALGSLSKSLTATAVMTLVEQGKVALNDPANLYLSPLQIASKVGNANEIKVWHLLNSCAGIPHGWSPEPTMLGIDKDENFRRFAVATVPPGRIHQYSNYSFGVLDRLIEQVSKMPLEEFFRRQVYQPLAMQHSFAVFDKNRSGEFATLYDDQLNPMPMYQFHPVGGGGHFSSAEDLAKYALFYLGQMQADQRAVFSAETIRLMHHFDQAPASTFRLGWFNSGHSISSNGNIPGGNANLTLLPAQKIGVVCLTNFSSFDGIADQIADEIVDLLVPDLQKQMTREKYMAQFEPPYQPGSALQGKWSGTVTSGDITLPLELHFPSDSQRVTIKIGNAPPHALERVVFNQYQKLTASFEGNVPAPGKTSDDNVYANLSLFLDGNQLVGYVAPIYECSGGSCCYGAFISAKR